MSICASDINYVNISDFAPAWPMRMSAEYVRNLWAGLKGVADFVGAEIGGCECEFIRPARRNQLSERKMMHKGYDLPDPLISIEGLQLFVKPAENVIQKFLVGHVHSHTYAVHPPNGNIEMPAGELFAEFFDESAIFSEAVGGSGRDFGAVERRRDA